MEIEALKTIQDNFVQELELAEQSKPSSLSFIKHTITKAPIVSQGEVFQVLVIGGSMFKKALVQRQDNHFVISKRDEKLQTPYVTKEDFLDFIEAELDPHVTTVALNFAYPLSPVLRDDRLDGVLIAGTKENTFGGLIGEQVGKTIEEHIAEKLDRSIKVAVANDTICVLLAGKGRVPLDRLACGIVGTGINFAFFLDDTTAVNLEAGNFDKFPQSLQGESIDKESTNPKKALIEKETAGAYLYKHFNLLLKEKRINYSPTPSTLELKNIALKNVPIISELALSVFEHSASLVAAEIGGLLLYKQRDLDFVVEGSLLWEPLYGNLLEKYLAELVPEYSATFIKIRESSIIGGAHLVA